MRFFSLQNIDLAGFIVSFLCAIHCAAMPILISWGLLSSTALESHAIFEWVIIGLSIIIASWSLFRSYIRDHRNLIPILIVTFGFALILIDHLSHAHGWMLVVGGLSIASAHLVNWKMLHSTKSRLV